MFSWSVVKDYIIADEFRSFIPIMKLISIWDNNGRKQKKNNRIEHKKATRYTRLFELLFYTMCIYALHMHGVLRRARRKKRPICSWLSELNEYTHAKMNWIKWSVRVQRGRARKQTECLTFEKRKKHTKTRKWTWKRSGIYSETDPWKLLLFPLEIRVSIIIGALHKTVDYCSQSVFHPLILTPSLCVSLSSSPHSLLFIDQLQTTKYKTFHILFVFRLWLLLCFARLQTHQILI